MSGLPEWSGWRGGGPNTKSWGELTIYTSVNYPQAPHGGIGAGRGWSEPDFGGLLETRYRLKMNRWSLSIKHGLDAFFAACILLILAPLLALVSLSILVVDGPPVLFRQARLGRFGKEFQIWKFRTMIRDADLFLSDEGLATCNRITRTGKLLRFLSFDELPQLINILKGEMSFVGPRPALVEHLERYTDRQKRRLLMRPGVTGLAQINGRNTLRWSKRIQYDIEYIDNYSLVLDFKILLKTVIVVLSGRGVVMDRNADKVDDLGN